MHKPANIWLVALTLLVAHAAQAKTIRLIYTDPQGTVIAETDIKGNIIARYDYRPYGAPVLGQAPSGPEYTGHVNDPEAGLVYMQHRYYDPMGLMLSVDPIAPSPGNVFNFNRYSYANNNPVTFLDPTGQATTAALRFNLTPFGIGPIHYNVGHEFVEIRDTDTGASWVTRGGPSGNYPPYLAVSNSTAVRNGSFPIFGPPMTLHVDTSSYATSVEAANTNYFVPNSVAEINLSFDEAIKKIQALGRAVNSANIPYRPRTTNSNAYANMVYTRLTGKNAPNQTIKFPDQDTHLPLPLTERPPPPPPPERQRNER